MFQATAPGGEPTATERNDGGRVVLVRHCAGEILRTSVSVFSKNGRRRLIVGAQVRIEGLIRYKIMTPPVPCVQ